jgi:hypothetical protein
VTKAIVRRCPAVRTGEADVIIPHGPERLEKMEITDSQA